MAYMIYKRLNIYKKIKKLSIFVGSILAVAYVAILLDEGPYSVKLRKGNSFVDVLNTYNFK